MYRDLSASQACVQYLFPADRLLFAVFSNLSWRTVGRFLVSANYDVTCTCRYCTCRLDDKADHADPMSGQHFAGNARYSDDSASGVLQAKGDIGQFGMLAVLLVHSTRLVNSYNFRTFPHHLSFTDALAQAVDQQRYLFFILYIGKPEGAAI